MKTPTNDANKELTLSTGKKLYFRKPKVIDHDQALAYATREGDVDGMLFSKDYLQRLLIAVQRKNNEFIKLNPGINIFRQEGVLNFEEISEVVNSFEDLGLLSKKKGVVKTL